MISKFAWRYFKAKKSANAINIIAWVTTAVIAFATCCQILVLSVFNGFEDLVKSLYSSFYSDLKIIPASGKTFLLDSNSIAKIKAQPNLQGLSMIAEDKALLKNVDEQTVVNLKGVDENYIKNSGVSEKIISGKFNVGTIDQPGLVVGAGIQNAVALMVSGGAFPPSEPTVILPKKAANLNDPLEALSQGNAATNGVFAIQQDFDNTYALTNIDFVKQQMGFAENEYSAAEIKLKPGIDIEKAKLELQKTLPKDLKVQSRFEQNMNLYSTMRMEKWAIFAILTLILAIAAFNMISALTMLVLEKRKDISILQSMGGTRTLIRKIFLSEGMLLGVLGGIIGIALATIICFLQLKFKLIKLSGGSFLIDYFPVKMLWTDLILVALTALGISFIASWFPADRASKQAIELKS